jgi:hypothetical protein
MWFVDSRGLAIRASSLASLRTDQRRGRVRVNGARVETTTEAVESVDNG